VSPYPKNTHRTISGIITWIKNNLKIGRNNNILIEPDGSERFPDFDLYRHIAAKIHGAVPSRQFAHPAFDRFQVNPSEVGDVKKWQLFA